MNESEQAQAIAEKLQTATTALIKQRSDWSEQMAIDCIMQAIKCGDFARLVHGDKEVYVYLPFQKANELEKVLDSQAQRIARLEYTVSDKSDMLTGVAGLHKEACEEIEKQAQKISEQAKEIERLKKILCDDLHYWNAYRDADGRVHVK